MGCCDGCDEIKGNFVYWRFASDSNGSDFSKYPNEGGIKRCWQAVYTSSVKLDETTASFENLFIGKYVDICCEGDCDCKKFDYHLTPDGVKNTWIYKHSTSPRYLSSPDYENRVRFIDIETSSKTDFLITNVKDQSENVEKLLQSGTEYCFEFYLTENTLTPGQQFLISLGSDFSSSNFVIDSDTPLGYHKKILIFNDLKVDSQSGIMFRFSFDSQVTEDFTLDFFEITDFRVQTKECCEFPDIQYELINSETTVIGSGSLESGEVGQIPIDDVELDIYVNGVLDQSLSIPASKDETININP